MSKVFEKKISLSKKFRRSRTSRVSALDIKLGYSQEPKNLTTDYIPLISNENNDKLFEKERELIVPPSSPRQKFVFGNQLETLPETFPSLKYLKIPYIRVKGIKNCIRDLGEFFRCTSYKTNMLQFWFLDMLTDCLWRCQDEYLLTEDFQKSVLDWIIYMFNIIRSPKMNLSRGQFFRLFREAISIAEDRLEIGDAHFLSPETLFNRRESSTEPVDYESSTTDSTNSSLSSDECGSDNSYLVVQSQEYPELPEFYELPRKKNPYQLSETSSIATPSERSFTEETNSYQDIEPANSDNDEKNLEKNWSISDFYQPDRKTHSRFFGEDGDERADDSEFNLETQEKESDLKYEWIMENKKSVEDNTEPAKSIISLNSHDMSFMSSFAKGKRLSSKKIRRTHHDLSMNASHSSTSRKHKFKPIPKKEEKEQILTDDELLKSWFQYSIWKQRAEDMADPKKGWKPTETDECDDDCVCSKIDFTSQDFENEEYVQIRKEWMSYLESHKGFIDIASENRFINACLLVIIKQFIFEYFHESFQYTLIKMAFQIAPYVKLEEINEKWLIPKLIKDDFKRPLAKKLKPETPSEGKKKKEPWEKKEDDKEEKKEKKDKGTQKKSKEPKEKPEKPHKLTKEEKDEIERLKEEERRRILEEIEEEENKRWIFPLSLAANHKFFKGIFKDYVIVEEIKQGKGKKKKSP